MQASLTGHLVFTTLHTNDAPSAIARLLDLGLEPFLVTATLEGIVAQRLVRTICPQCKEEFTPTEEMLLELDLTPEDVAGPDVLPRRGLRLLPQHRLQRADGHLRDHGAGRRAARPDHEAYAAPTSCGRPPASAA